MDITEKTKAPLFAIMIAVSAIISAEGYLVWWTAGLWSQVAEATKTNDRQDADMKDFRKEIIEHWKVQDAMALDTHDMVVAIKAKTDRQ